MDPLSLFIEFLRASALSVGGLASLPLLRSSLVPTVTSDAQIVQAVAIGRLSPGPNGLYLVSLGYLIDGWTGAAVAFIAACLTPLVIIPLTTLARGWLLSAWFAGVVRGVALASAGLLAATGILIVMVSGAAPWQLVLAAVATALTITGRVHPAVLIGAGALAGIAFAR